MTDKQIFISHSSDDSNHAGELAQLLSKQGFKPWLAKSDIPLGGNFAEEITRAIKDSNYFIVLLSRSSIASPHVKREVSIAVDKGIPLLPVIIGGSEDFVNTMPEEWIYWLTVVQVVHFENSTQTADEIISHIASGKLSGRGSTPINLPSARWRWVAASVVVSIASLLFFIGATNDPKEGDSGFTPNTATEETQEPVTQSSQKTAKPESSKSPSAVLGELAVRLNKSGSVKWSVEEKIQFPIGEIGRIQSSDYECELSVFPDLKSANFASDDRNYTTNAYVGWLDKDSYSNSYIIMTATDGDTPCGRAASKALGWPTKVYLGDTYLEPGATPFEKCLIAQVREYGGSKDDAIGPCKFQFERDGKAIPEQYLKLD